MRKFTAFFTSTALVILFAACSGGDSSEAPSAPPPEPAAEPAAAEPAEEPAAAEPAADEAPAEEAAPEAPSEEGGSACEAYAQCCSDYVDALGAVAGMEAASGAAKTSCDQIAGMKGLPTANEVCQQALDGMKTAMGAYAAIPDFVVPGSCS